jgi:FAD/FMN-containing dehydrogenase
MAISPAAGTAARPRIGDSALAARLRRELEGEVLFDAFSRGRYSTDASVYVRTIQIAAEEGVPVLPRGGGTSQCGQTVAEAIVVDVSKHLDAVKDFDPEARRVTVQPGLVLDRLNAVLQPHGLMFPVDVSTASRATIGGMAGNNSCGARSLAYGTMRDNVAAIDAVLADGQSFRFGELANGNGVELPTRQRQLTETLLGLGRREAGEIAARFPKLMRRVGGYNIDALAGNAPPNLGHLLVGSEGTLAFSTAIELALRPVPPVKVLGVCHFPSFYQAMDSTRHIVALGPTAVELVDRTMIELSRDIPLFRRTVDAFVKGAPEALLLVEFAGEERAEQLAGLKRLGELMGELGFPGAVVEAADPAFQKAIWEVRKAGLNIMMSMKGDGKPVSFIEDCAVALEDLADYTERLTRVFEKHGTTGTWSTSSSRPTPGRCARSPRRPSPWCASTRARTRASTATAWCAPSSTRPCSARAWSRPSRRSRRASTPRACSTRARSSARPGWTTVRCSASSRATGARRRKPPSTGRTGAASPARSRCATTTAPAARPTPTSCAPPTGSPGTSST